MKRSDFLIPAPPNFVWPQCPDADQFARDRVAEFLQGHSFARRLAERMKEETNTEFISWVDHVVLPKRKYKEVDLAKLGYIKEKGVKSPKGTKLFWHPYADLPRMVLSSRSLSLSCAIMVDSISDFQLIHKLSLPIEGAPYSSYRESRIFGQNGELRVIERRGTRSIIPDFRDRACDYVDAVEAWLNRPRIFPSQKIGIRHAQALAQAMVRALGEGMAAWAFLEAERKYWQSKNRAAQIQKVRQDKLGLGWSNHDHHTFRSGRLAFPGLIKILLTFGFKKRERYYAGAEAGWGAQIMEQPEARLIIFADVDLSPKEVSVDFTRVALPELEKPGTVGLWCALHGESILEAGMHHLEAKFEFEGLRDTLPSDGVKFMKPFSDFPHLRQAFSEGEIWRVPGDRLDMLRNNGKLSEEAYEKIKQNGAVGSHMENLQRRNGFKGFNQRGVSEIIKAVNPEAQALKNIPGSGA